MFIGWIFGIFRAPSIRQSTLSLIRNHNDSKIAKNRLTQKFRDGDTVQFLCTKTDVGGGFFLACKDFGGMFNNSFPACTFFLTGD